jgi:adenylate cyclase
MTYNLVKQHTEETMPKFKAMKEEDWRAALMGHHHQRSFTGKMRHVFGAIPSNPRCKFCNAPFAGIGGGIFRMVWAGPFEKNPNFCGNCLFTSEIGGVEIEITMLFADVRGSTTLAEGMSPSEFSKLMNRFYAATTDVLIKSDAWLDKLVGDEVIGLFIPGYAGPDHPRVAVEAAQNLLRATGHDNPDGPWIPVGAGVHTGVAYVGLVGTEGGVSDLTALGDAMNTTARLASQAKAGEILVSQASYTAAGLDTNGLDHRALQLKGRTEPVDVCVLRVAPA